MKVGEGFFVLALGYPEFMDLGEQASRELKAATLPGRRQERRERIGRALQPRDFPSRPRRRRNTGLHGLAQRTRSNFRGCPHAGYRLGAPSTSEVRRPGREGLRVDVLAAGATLGETIQPPELDWHAQTVPYYDYLLEDSRQAAILAGGHCIPVVLPSVDRMIWHKLYSSTKRTNEPEKAEKDLIQAATLAAIIVEQGSANLSDSFHEAPKALRAATMDRIPRIHALLTQHPEARDAFGALSIDR